MRGNYSVKSILTILTGQRCAVLFLIYLLLFLMDIRDAGDDNIDDNDR